VLEGGRGPRVFLTDVAMVDISATEIRAAARTGRSEKLRAMVPAAVANYIEKYELYKN
jgi:nicotinic acid mononucleotide adenylyltransferase